MASIHKTNAGYEVRWRYAGRRFNQSARTKSASEAEAIKGRIDDTERALTEGWLSLLDGAEYATVKRFLFSGGKKSEPEGIQASKQILTLGDLFARYRGSQPSNEESTLYTETIHQNHVLRPMGEGREVEAITFKNIQLPTWRRK